VLRRLVLVLVLVVVVMVMLVETVVFAAISDGGSSRDIADVFLASRCAVYTTCSEMRNARACCNDGDGRST
jgi:hypothetical protein